MRNDRERLDDILRAIAQIQKRTDDGRDLFNHDEMLRVWVVHHLQMIGEAARALDDVTRRRHPHVPWATIIGMRHILVHEYFGLNWDVVWDTVERDIPKLKQHIERIVHELDERARDEG